MSEVPNSIESDDGRACADARLRRVGIYVAAIVGGGICGLMAVVLPLRWWGPGALREVTATSLQEAQVKWRDAEVSSYDLEVVVTAADTSTFVVQVRDNIVRDAKRNGDTLKHQRTWSTWTVAGMFETIERDLETAARNQNGATGAASHLLLQGVFDPQSGVPRRYQRTEIQRVGTNREVHWEVTRFERL